jgi:hypothetical protein
VVEAGEFLVGAETRPTELETCFDSIELMAVMSFVE